MREELTEVYNVKDHMVIFPVLFHACSLRQRRKIPPYVRAVIFLSASEHIGIPSLII